MGLHFLGFSPHATHTRKLKGQLLLSRSLQYLGSLEFHQISNIWFILDSRKRQKGIVWTYWKSTHRSYSWICNSPSQIANAALKYCLRSSSLGPEQGKLMNNPLLLQSTYLLQTFLLSVASGLSKVGSNEFKAGINIVNFQCVPRIVSRAGIPSKTRSYSLSRWEE